MSATEYLQSQDLAGPRAGRKITPRRFFTLLCGVAAATLLAAAVYAHIRLAPFGNKFEGRLAVLDRVFDIMVAVALLAVCQVIGSAAACRIAVPLKGRAEKMVFSVALGLGIVGLLLFALGIIGLLNPGAVAASLALLLGLSVVELRRFTNQFIFHHRGTEGAEAAQRARNSSLCYLRALCASVVDVLLLKHVGSQADVSEKTIAGESFKSRLLLLLLLGLFIVVLLVRALTPPFELGDQITTLSAIRAFVEQGRIVPLYDNAYGNDPFLAQMLYAVCVMLKTDIAPKVLNLGLGVMCDLAAFAFANRFFSRRAAYLALAMFWGAQAISEVAVTVRADMTLALLCFLAFYATACWAQEKDRRWLAAAILLCGFSLGISHFAVFWVFMLTLIVAVEGRKAFGAPARQAARRAAVFLALSLAIGSPWYVKNLVYFYNPVYPLFTGEAASYPGEPIRYFNQSDEQQLQRFYEEALRDPAINGADKRDEVFRTFRQWPNNNPLFFWNLILYPEAMSREADLFPNYLFFVLGVYFFLRKNLWATWLMLLGVGLYAAACVPYRDFSMRHLLPAFPGLTVAVAYCFDEMIKRLQPRSRLPLGAIAAGLAAAMLLSIGLLNTQFIEESNTTKFVAGTVSRARFLAPLDYYRPLYFIHHFLPTDSRVMLFNAQVFYNVDRAVIENGSGSLNTPWRRALARAESLQALHEDLRAQGVTHILYSEAVMNNVETEEDARISARNAVTFEAYRERHLEQVECAVCPFTFSVYRLK